jgi:putative MFS transporter
MKENKNEPDPELTDNEAAPMITQSEEDDDLLLIDKITCKYGYGIHIWAMIICVILVIGTDGYFTTIFSSMIIAYQEKFNLKDHELMFLATIFFVFKILGAVVVGQITTKLCRVVVINTSLFILTITNLTVGLYNNLTYFYISRIITGYFCGTIETVITNVLCEHLPIQKRGFVLTSVWTGWSVAQIIPNILMLYYMPNFEPAGIEKCIVISTAIPLISFIFCALFFKDSPRNYILKGEYDKAFEILKKYDNTLNEEDKEQLVSEITQGVNKDTEASVSELFSKNFYILTIAILCLSFMSNMLNDGFALIVNLTLDEVNNSKNVLKDSLIVILFSMPSCFLAGMFSEIRSIGRRWCNLFGYIFLMSSIALAVLFPKYISTFLGLYNIFINFGNIVIITYTSEIYPTKIRDIGSGLSSTFSNLGSCSSQLIFISLHSISPFTPYYFIIGICVVCTMISYMLPYETYHRPLDSKYKEERISVYDDKKHLLEFKK